MSNSKFRSPFSPDRRRSPERTLSPDLELAIIKEAAEFQKETVFAELNAAVSQLSANLSKFFSNFKSSPTEKWTDSSAFLSNVPASLDLRQIVGLPPMSDFEKTKSDFLPLLNNVCQVQKILDLVDKQFGHLQDPDLLFHLGIRATLLLEVQHKYSRFFYQQVKDASARLVLLDELKSLEERLFEISFPKYLVTLSLDHKLSHSLDKKAALREGLTVFFEKFDALNSRYRQVQKELVHSYSSFVNFGGEILPSQAEIAQDRKEYFRKPFFDTIRKSVQDLMVRVTDNYDDLFDNPTPIGAQGRSIDSYNDRLEEHLQEILNKIDQLGVETVRDAQVSPEELPSMDSLNIADESILSYYDLIQKQFESLESDHIKHLLVFEDKAVPKEDLPAADLFLDTLFALENSSKLSYDQLNATEAVVQRYLSSNGQHHKDFKTVSKLLDSVSNLKVLWSSSWSTCQKSRMLLDSYQKKNNVNQQQRSVLARCSLPSFPTDAARNPLSYGAWRLEWQSLIKSVQDSGQRVRLLRQSLDSHKFARGLIKFSKNIESAFEILDLQFQQKSSLGIRVNKEIYAIPLSGDSLKQECYNIRRFKDLVNQLEFHDINPADQLGTSAITHVCTSLTQPHEDEYLSRRTQLQFENEMPVQEQFDDFIHYLDNLLRNNTTVLQARNLRSSITAVDGDKNQTGNSQKQSNQSVNQGYKQRDIVQKKNGSKTFETQNNKFDSKKNFPKKVNLPSQKSKENTKHCLFCGLSGHNQWGRCKEILSRLTDQPALLKKLEEKRLCCSCLHSLDNGSNSHHCKDSFKVKDKSTQKEVTKSALCPKYCRAPVGNVRLHSRICSCAAREYTDGLRALQSKMIAIRPKAPSSALSSSSPPPSISEVVVGEPEQQANGLMRQHFGEEPDLDGAVGETHPSTVNLCNGTVILANTEVAAGAMPEDDEGHLVNGCTIGGCVRMSERVEFVNGDRRRFEGCLFDSGATNTCSSPDIQDLATNSWVLPESFNLVTQNGIQSLELIRDQYRTANNLRFQAIRLPKAPDDLAFVILHVPLRYQIKYGMEPQYSIQTGGHSLVMGNDMASNFPHVCEVDEQTGFGIFQSKITGQFLPFSTGRVHRYCAEEAEEAAVPPIPAYL